MARSDDLFLEVAYQAGSTYISDLRYARPMWVAFAVARTSLAYPPEQWADLYRYLLGEEPPKGSDQRRIRALLVEKLPHADLRGRP